MTYASTASAPNNAAAPHHDLWTGEDEWVLAPARYINKLFACSAPEAYLANFISHIYNRTQIRSQTVLMASLVLLTRLKRRFPSAKGSSGHRLLLAAFMISHKTLCDASFSNQSWTIVSRGMFTLKEVNQMEREMLDYLGWDLAMDRRELNRITSIVFTHYLSRPAPPTETLPSAPIPTPEEAAACYPSPTSSPESLPSPPLPPAPSTSSFQAFSSGESTLSASPSSSVDATPLHTPTMSTEAHAASSSPPPADDVVHASSSSSDSLPNPSVYRSAPHGEVTVVSPPRKRARRNVSLATIHPHHSNSSTSEQPTRAEPPSPMGKAMCWVHRASMSGVAALSL